MVCERCITAVKGVFDELEIAYSTVVLGAVEVVSELSEAEINKVDESLNALGFERVLNPKEIVVNRIKSLVIQFIYNTIRSGQKYSDFLSQQMNRDYSYLSSVFSQQTGISLEKYVITQRIERVKELLVLGNQSVSEIAFALNYSSGQHLSKQFKGVVGCTPSEYRNKTDALTERKALDLL